MNESIKHVWTRVGDRIHPSLWVNTKWGDAKKHSAQCPFHTKDVNNVGYYYGYCFFKWST